ncbi:hypothetical protein AVEN_267684-1 [Araneus ventricosus]|uniref:RNase H type-1 domain-containing protein n=1 Tax=Araneus ventricosus TaxID=182803 RepID=A0A4Y2N2X9_ARAVE|nr:hypothetical protein AVEN_267684-1 [Araneus ventricosus]
MYPSLIMWVVEWFVLAKKTISYGKMKLLNNEASVFLAEAYAIPIALQKTSDERIRIYIDSESVLLALESSRIQSSIILDIKKKNIRKYKKFVEFYWVKAHIGIHGNELADVSAGNATKRETIDQIIKPSLWYFII